MSELQLFPSKQVLTVVLLVLITGITLPVAAAASTDGGPSVQQEANSNIEQSVTVNGNEGGVQDGQNDDLPGEDAGTDEEAEANESDNDTNTGDDETGDSDRELLEEIKQTLDHILYQLQLLVALVAGGEAPQTDLNDTQNDSNESDDLDKNTTEEEDETVEETETDEASNEPIDESDDAETPTGNTGTWSHETRVTQETNVDTNVEQRTEVIVIGPWTFENPLDTVFGDDDDVEDTDVNGSDDDPDDTSETEVNDTDSNETADNETTVPENDSDSSLEDGENVTEEEDDETVTENESVEDNETVEGSSDANAFGNVSVHQEANSNIEQHVNVTGNASGENMWIDQEANANIQQGVDFLRSVLG